MVSKKQLSLHFLNSSTNLCLYGIFDSFKDDPFAQFEISSSKMLFRMLLCYIKPPNGLPFGGFVLLFDCFCLFEDFH